MAMVSTSASSVLTFRNPDDEAIKTLLAEVETIAIVGLSPKPNRPSYQVARRLKHFGYKIIPVRPAIDAILGERAYSDLAQVPGKIDLVDVFVAPGRVGAIVDACVGRGIPAVWLQEGVVNEAAARLAQAAGMKVIMDRCVSRDYLSLFGDRPVNRVRAEH